MLRKTVSFLILRRLFLSPLLSVRKVRMQATELANERDSLKRQVEDLRSELAEAQREIVLARQPVVEEKLYLELKRQVEELQSELAEANRDCASTLTHRSLIDEKRSLKQLLDEDRKAKERLCQQLDARLDELSKRKSKFVYI